MTTQDEALPEPATWLAVNKFTRDINFGAPLFVADQMRAFRDAAIATQAARIAELEKECAGLRESIQPFIERNSSDEFITIKVRTADVWRARSAAARAAGEKP